MDQAPKILLIDDDPELHHVVKLSLPEDVVLDCATTEADALSMVSRKNYDILIIDINLEITTGFNFLDKLKDQNLAVDSTKIVLTSSRKMEDEISSHNHSVEEFVQKPIRHLVFEAIIEKHLKKRTQSDVWSRGNLLIDINKMKVTGKNKDNLAEDIVLTPKEFKILIKLINHPGKGFTREQIFEDVWREEDDSNLRSVDTHVSGLRKKIINYGVNLNSVRSVGYKIDLL